MNRTLAGGLCLSLLCHLALLAAWQDGRWRLPVRPAESAGVSVTLLHGCDGGTCGSDIPVAAEGRSPGGAAATMEGRPPGRAAVTAEGRSPGTSRAVRKGARVDDVPVATTAAEGRSPGGTSAAAESRSRSEDLRARVRARLEQDLKRHFTYPPLARRRGWQGDVLLSLVVTPGGRIGRIEVLHSSGYAVLDHSAVATLRRIRHIAGIAREWQGGSIDVELPVHYRLL